MQRAMWFFAVSVILLSFGLGALAFLFGERLGQYSGVLMLPLVVVPLLMVYIAHRISSAAGNPFRGLVFGNTSWLFLAWLGGLLVGAVGIVVCLGLKFNGWDMGMTEYLNFVVAQSEKSGQPMPKEAIGFVSASGWGTAIAGPTFGAWIGGAMSCLAVFPWYGWFFRRLLASGRASAIVLLMVLNLLTGIASGLAPNPAFEDVAIGWRMAIFAAAGMAFVPALVWIFLRTRSAVVPSLFLASVSSMLSSVMPFTMGGHPLLGLPSGFATSVIVLLAGLALWLIKDPGGMDLAVAAVAFDGTPLTLEQARALNEPAPPAAG